MAEIAAGHPAGLRRDLVKRPDRGGPQTKREHHHDDRQADRDGDEYDVKQRRGVVQGRDRLAPGGRDGTLKGCDVAAQRVKVRLACGDVGTDHRLAAAADLVDGRYRVVGTPVMRLGGHAGEVSPDRGRQLAGGPFQAGDQRLLRGVAGVVRSQEGLLAAEGVAAHASLLVEQRDVELLDLKGYRVERGHHPFAIMTQVEQGDAADHHGRHREEQQGQDADAHDPAERPAFRRVRRRLLPTREHRGRRGGLRGACGPWRVGVGWGVCRPCDVCGRWGVYGGGGGGG